MGQGLVRMIFVLCMVTATRVVVGKLCAVQPMCDACDAACNMGMIGDYEAGLESCRKSVKLVEEYLEEKEMGVENVEGKCWFKSCYEMMKKKRCGLGLKGSEKEMVQQLKKMIRDKREEGRKVGIELEKARREFERSEEYAYHKSLVQAEMAVAKQRVRALETRKYNDELKRYMESVEWRGVKQEVGRLRMENEELRRQWEFWVVQNRTLGLAVRTSMLGLKRVRDMLEGRMREYEADAELVGVLRKGRMTREEQIGLVSVLKEDVRRELWKVGTMVARMRSEEEFLKKAGREMYGLVNDVLREVRSGRGKVGCGIGELGRQVGYAIFK